MPHWPHTCEGIHGFDWDEPPGEGIHGFGWEGTPGDHEPELPPEPPPEPPAHPPALQPIIGAVASVCVHLRRNKMILRNLTHALISTRDLAPRRCT